MSQLFRLLDDETLLGDSGIAKPHWLCFDFLFDVKLIICRHQRIRIRTMEII